MKDLARYRHLYNKMLYFFFFFFTVTVSQVLIWYDLRCLVKLQKQGAQQYTKDTIISVGVCFLKNLCVCYIFLYIHIYIKHLWKNIPETDDSGSF